jgi:hypothetical protein
VALSDIVTVKQVYDWLEIDCPSENETEAVLFLKRRAERMVRRYLGCAVTQGTYTHYLPTGNAFHDRRARSLPYYRSDNYYGQELKLPEYPLRSVTSIYEDRYAYAGDASGAWASTTELTAGTDYYAEWDQDGLSKRGYLLRLKTGWSSVPKSIKITYTAGWSSSELSGDVTDVALDASDIQLATLKYIAKAYLTRGGEGGGVIQSEQLADFKVTYSSNEKRDEYLTDELREMLNQYKRLEWSQ